MKSIRIAVLAAAFGLAAAAFAQGPGRLPALPETPDGRSLAWVRLSARLALADVDPGMELPDEPPNAWATARAADLVGGRIPGDPTIHDGALRRWIELVRFSSMQAWEEALLHVAIETGELPAEHAAAWSSALRAAPDGFDAAFDRALLLGGGSVFGASEETCFADPRTSERLVVATRVERAVPPWRGPATHEVDAIRLLQPTAGVPLLDGLPPGCGDLAARLAALAWLDAPSVRAQAAEWIWRAETGALPRSPIVRAALRGHLAQNTDLVALAANIADAQGWHRDDVDALRLLARIGTLGRDARDDRAAGTGTLARFAEAELLRLEGRPEDALRLLDALVREDGFFAAALIARAAVLVALGRRGDAAADIQHLRVTFPHDPTVTRWVDAFDRPEPAR